MVSIHIEKGEKCVDRMWDKERQGEEMRSMEKA